MRSAGGSRGVRGERGVGGELPTVVKELRWRSSTETETPLRALLCWRAGTQCPSFLASSMTLLAMGGEQAGSEMW